MEKNRWGIIYGSHAGLKKSAKRWVAIRKYIEKRGVQYDPYLPSAYEAHLYEPFPEITLAADLYHDASIPCLQIR